MPRVPPPAPPLGFANCHLRPSFRCPPPSARAREYARRTQNLGSLGISLTSGRSPPTRPRDWGGGSFCGRVGAGLPGTLPPPGTLCPGSRAGRKPAGQPGAEQRRGSLRATAHECEPYTCSVEHLAEKHVFSASTRTYHLSSLFPGSIGFLRDSYSQAILIRPSDILGSGLNVVTRENGISIVGTTISLSQPISLE